MKAHMPPPVFSPPPEGGAKGTVFRVIRGSNLFKKEDPNKQLWHEKFGQEISRPTRTRPCNAQELLNVITLRLKNISPPESLGYAKVWINHDQTPEKKMAGAVTLGEEGQRDDLPLLQRLLKDHRTEVRACAIQGMSRLCERFPPPEPGEALLEALVDVDVSVRDLARELLLGHGWLQSWLLTHSSQTALQSSQKKQRYLSNVLEFTLLSNRFTQEEKDIILQQFKTELGEELVSSCLLPAIRLACSAVEEQIRISQQALQLLKDDPLAGYGVHVQHGQMVKQQSFLTFLQESLAKCQRTG